MDRKTQELIKEAQRLVNKLTVKNHLLYQVTTHIDLVQRTGEGVEVLEHFVAFNQQYKNKSTYLNRMRKLFYCQGMILDANEFVYEYWNKANRHNRWTKVKRITYNNKPKCRDKRPGLDK